jgi:hypothetical protein
MITIAALMTLTGCVATAFECTVASVVLLGGAAAVARFLV